MSTRVMSIFECVLEVLRAHTLVQTFKIMVYS